MTSPRVFNGRAWAAAPGRTSVFTTMPQASCLANSGGGRNGAPSQQHLAMTGDKLDAVLHFKRKFVAL